jgi:hypothetical protein
MVGYNGVMVDVRRAVASDPNSVAIVTCCVVQDGIVGKPDTAARD